ncbi:MAG: GMC family oxidoreductase [Planctomycetota bacterium]
MSPHSVFAALAEMQLIQLRGNANIPIDDPKEVATDILKYLDTIPPFLRTVIEAQLVLLNLSTVVTHGRVFTELPADTRKIILQKTQASGPTTFFLGISWMVIFSRDWARNVINFSEAGANTIKLDAPPPQAASLAEEYDLCIIGTGAGASVVAARVGAECRAGGRLAGKKILMIEAGSWVNPKNLNTRHDHALMRLYKTGGAQPALPEIDALITGQQSGINVLQARTAGGGPTVNNAIQLPIDAGAYTKWLNLGFPDRRNEISAALRRVATDLGIHYKDPFSGAIMAGRERSQLAAGRRSDVLLANLGDPTKPLAPLPVSLWDCIGCGGCNTGCRFGMKTSGIHGPRAAEANGDAAPKSYFMRALEDTDNSVSLRCNITGKKLDINNGEALTLRAIDTSTGKPENITIRAKHFAVAAGPIASSFLIEESIGKVRGAELNVGRRLSANVIVPMYGIFDEDLGATQPNPGLQMCYFSDPDTGVLLETWFDYPGSVSLALNGDAAHVAATMSKYHQLAMVGVVIPIDDIGWCDTALPFDILMKLTNADFERVLRGIAHAAVLLFNRGANIVFPGHRVAVKDVLDRTGLRNVKIDKTAALNGDIPKIVAYLKQVIVSSSNLSLQTAHPQGGNALANDPAHGVVGPDFKIFGIRNVYVTDSSLFPAGARVNPQMTAMALAHLAADQIINDLL